MSRKRRDKFVEEFEPHLRWFAVFRPVLRVLTALTAIIVSIKYQCSNARTILGKNNISRQLSAGKKLFFVFSTDNPADMTSAFSRVAASGASKVLLITTDQTHCDWAQLHDCNSVNLRDYWVDSETNIEIHGHVAKLAAELRKHFSSVRVGRRELFEFLKLEMFHKAIFFFRVAKALRAAKERDCDVILLLMSENTDMTLHLQRMAQSIYGDNLSCGIVYRSFRKIFFSNLHLHPSILSRRSFLNKWVLAYPAMPENALWFRKVFRKLLSPFQPKIASYSDFGKNLETKSIAIACQAAKGSSYWRSFENVIRRLREHGIPYFAVTTSVQSYLDCERNDIPVVMNTPLLLDNDFWQERQVQAFLKQASELSLDSFDVDIQEAFLPYREEIQAVLSWVSDIDRALDLDVAWGGIRQWEKLICKRGAERVWLVPHWSYGGQWAIIASCQLGRSTYSYPAATVASNHASIIGWEDIDVICSYGMQCSDAFLALGYTKDRFVQIGNANLDHLWQMDQDRAYYKLVQSGIIIEPDRKLVLIATSRIDSNESVWINSIISYCACHGSLQVVIKVHPSFSVTDYRKVTWSGSSHCQIVENADVHDLLKISTVCVTDCSTVGAEAIMLGKRLVVANLTEKTYKDNNYVELGVAEGIFSIDEVEPTLSRIFAASAGSEALDDSIAKFRTLYNYGNDGKAADRMASLLIGKKDQ